MNRSAIRLAAGAMLLALSAAACGTAATSNSGTGSPASRASASSPAGSGTAMSAGQASRAALAALTAATSVHVRGTFTVSGRGERFDMRFEGNSASGSFTVKGAPIQAIMCSSSLYLKAGPDGWTAMGNPRETAGMMAGQWFKTSPFADPGGSPLTMGFFTAELAAHATATSATITSGTLGGHQVMIVTYPDGSKLYIPATGAAYPLRFDVTGSTGGRRDFSDYGIRFHITAPRDAVATS